MLVGDVVVMGSLSKKYLLVILDCANFSVRSNLCGHFLTLFSVNPWSTFNGQMSWICSSCIMQIRLCSTSLFWIFGQDFKHTRCRKQAVCCLPVLIGLRLVLRSCYSCSLPSQILALAEQIWCLGNVLRDLMVDGSTTALFLWESEFARPVRVHFGVRFLLSESIQSLMSFIPYSFQA